MIQRIQTVYLSFTTAISLLLLKGSFLSFSEKAGSVIKITFSGIFRDTNGQGVMLIEKLLPLSVLIVLIPVLALITIFSFKNRKIQKRLSLFLIILAAGFVLASIHVSFSIISKFEARIIPGFKMILPIIILIVSIFAYRGIKKDDKLVKSNDRLR
jgi:uncharacterized membrane protein